MQSFSEKISQLMTENGHTQISLGKALNVSQAAVAKWRNSKSTPSPKIMLAISNYFKIPVSVLTNDNLTLPNETKKNYSIRDAETVKIREDFEKLMALKNEISESLSEFSAMFDKRLSNIEKILRDKKF